jgi:glyoxylase-like metal-dependent hydrolase (beta-lactamase superfamily II)
MYRRRLLRATSLAAALALLWATGASREASAQNRTTLDIYVVDVEGGNATLLVSPSGESVLIDTGNVGAEAAVRDAERIMAAAKDASLSRIEHVITTHWHNDHFGGMVELAKRSPIRSFIDHGPTVQPNPILDEFLSPGAPAHNGPAHWIKVSAQGTKPSRSAMRGTTSARLASVPIPKFVSTRGTL